MSRGPSPRRGRGRGRRARAFRIARSCARAWRRPSLASRGQQRVGDEHYYGSLPTNHESEEQEAPAPGLLVTVISAVSGLRLAGSVQAQRRIVNGSQLSGGHRVGRYERPSSVVESSGCAARPSHLASRGARRRSPTVNCRRVARPRRSPRVSERVAATRTNATRDFIAITVELLHVPGAMPPSRCGTGRWALFYERARRGAVLSG